VREATYQELQETLASTEDDVRSFLLGMSKYSEAAADSAAEQPLGFLVGGSWAAAQPRLLRAQGPTPLCVF